MITLSASQIDTARLCRRKRWFQSIMRLPQVTQGSAVFGTILDGVVTRYLEADELGRDKFGRPVELYPAGWETCKDGTISIVDQSKVKKLVQMAIESGLLERVQGRQCQHKFVLPLVPGEVEILGYIDVLMPGMVWDHKTTSNMKWAKSTAKLREDVQMLIYAKVALERAKERGEAVPETIHLRHNVYVRGNQYDERLRVRKTPAEVTREEVETHWNGLAAEVQLYIRDNEITTLDQWKDISIEDKDSGACVKFGGCAFTTICGKIEHPANYKRRVDLLLQTRKQNVTVQESVPTTPTNIGETEAMAEDVFNKKLAQMSAGKGKTPPASTAAPAVNAGVKPQPASAAPAKPAVAPPATAPATSTVAQETPPWAWSACQACSTGQRPGFNTKGGPCRICDIQAAKEGKPQSSAYVIMTDDNGIIIWEERGDASPGGAAVAAPSVSAPAPTVAKTAQAPAAVPIQVDEPEVEEDETEEQAATQAPALDAAAALNSNKRGRGRPPEGMTLLIGVSKIKGPDRDTVQLEDVLRTLGNEMANKIEAGKSYYEINAFTRRDAMAIYAEQIAQQYAGKDVVCSGRSPDLDALLAALTPYAGRIYRSFTS